MSSPSQDYTAAVAIIGMAGRFPGARTISDFWRNITTGVCSIRHFSDDELLAAGVDPEVLRQPNYVKAGTVIEDVDHFDAAFFGYSPREAEVMDPQLRCFMECAWEGLEDAAYDPERFQGTIGIYAGSALSMYVLKNIFTHPEIINAVSPLQIGIVNSPDDLASTIAYKFNLKGPSVAVQSFCSTSLVAVHLACQSLITYECDMALAGGVALSFPHGVGYVYQEGGIVSPDGYCRTFDARGQGSVMGDGAGIVVLKRMEEALADGDRIYAVIRGSATNNDGLRKVGYTAPGLDGQASVILRALDNADIKPETLSYIEAHGTATPLGDAVELAAMIKAFRRSTQNKQFCAIGSVKPNIGHLDRASGIAGLIKTALALKNQSLPPSLNFEQANPDIDLNNSPFYVNTQLTPWLSTGAPRRAGVSSFGLGGTNAHVILEEAPELPLSSSLRPYHLLLFSAKTATSLETATNNFIAKCQCQPDLSPADVAYTLQVGRAAFGHRRIVVASDLADAAATLDRRDPQRVLTVTHTSRDLQVAFVLGGVGEHYPGMAQALYQHEPTFRQTIDDCCRLLLPLLGHDLRALLWPPTALAPAGLPATGESLRALLSRNGHMPELGPLQQTALAQPAVFVVEYALAQLLQSWGLRPTALLGYSLGEYVAACLAGVLSVPDALRLVATRAQLIQTLPLGAMLAVALSEAAVAPYLSAEVALAAVNGPTTCVLAGTPAAIAAVAAQLTSQEIACRPVATTHAFHSPLLQPIADQLTAVARTLTLHPPQVPYLSNVTGTWITAEQATDPTYWAQHLCQTVRFGDGIADLLTRGEQVLLEVGAGQALGSFVKQHPACPRAQFGLILPTLPSASEAQDALAFLLMTLGKLWLAGVSIDWSGFYQHEQRRRVPLPTYPFERQRFWIAPNEQGRVTPTTTLVSSANKRSNIADWFYVPVWQPMPLPTFTPDARIDAESSWLIIMDTVGLGEALGRRIRQQDRTAIQVHLGEQFERLGDHAFTVRSNETADYHRLLRILRENGQMPTHILHLSCVLPLTERTGEPVGFRRTQDVGFYNLIGLVQALGAEMLAAPIKIVVCTNGMQAVLRSMVPQAEQATVLGLCAVIGQENNSVNCRSVDLLIAEDSYPPSELLLDRVLVECATGTDPVVAYHGTTRFVQHFQPVRLDQPPSVPLRQQGVYLITGGLGGVGQILSLYLARTQQARLVLVGRTVLPPRSEWATWLAQAAPDDPLRPRLEHIQALEALGAEVLVLSADIANADQMQAVVTQTLAHFGALHGVIHAAGISGEHAFGLIADLQPAQCELHFQPKVHGLYVLETVLGELPLDFCLLCSSISAVLGGLGLAGYAAANSFIDAFTQRHNRTHPMRWISVNWDTWQLPTHQHQGIGATVAQFAMTPVEGVQAFERVISGIHPQLINSTGDLDARIRQWVQLESLRASIETPSMPLTGHARPALATTYVAPMGEQEQRIAAVWQQVLGLAEVGIHDNFFDLGGNSLIGLQLIARLKQALHTQVPIVALFEAPTIHTLAAYLFPSPVPQADQAAQTIVERRERVRQGRTTHDGIAIIGMVGRFPGAASVEQFWQNLQDGVEALTTFSDAELLAAAVAPELVHDPAYVKARPILDDVAHFDAAFFGYTPREAELMDPQQRLFHECAWEALELAGYDSLRYPGLIGIFGGANISSYLLQLLTDPQIRLLMNDATIADNDKDGLTTNVSYKLNLKGPSFAVQTFCSTSLVATHLACRSLRHGECDIALAGGVSVRVPVQAGYLYQEGDQVSPDGHIRTFDAQAGGAVWGDGVGVVVLKRLAEALADGDTIHAVIKGSAVNNDGGLKVGYTAPSVAGQTAAVVAALEDAGVPAESISYVEAHGTATPIGDPIEVASLTKAFRQTTDRTAFCFLGSVKPNVGHLDRAAGVTGLIKTVMALQHGLLPATLHFQQPNPEIDFAASPFVVTTALTPWPRNGSPRRAGVNSLGVGGTNAHVILEEAPLLQPSGPSRPVQLLLLSAKTPTALEMATSNLQHYLTTHGDVPLADVAYTLQVGRRRFAHRRMLVCRDVPHAIELLTRRDVSPLLTREQADTTRPVAFLLGGVGEHYPGMAQALYQHEPTFRQAVDECCRLLQPLLGQDLRTHLWPSDSVPPAASSPHTLLSRNGHMPELGPLQQTALAQPAVFVVEYALAQLLEAWGIRPTALLGYSLGEYVAACLAGVLSLPDALRLVTTRAQLIQTLPPGAMLAVALAEADVTPYLSAEVALAAVNGPTTCVLAGAPTAIATVAQQLTAQEIACRPVATTHAFHSSLLQPIADQLTAVARTLTVHPPQVPYLSNVTGTWITAEQATDPTYWAQHLCQTVRFEQGIAALLTRGEQALLEVGVGQALGSFVKQHPACPRAQFGLVLPTLPSASDAQDALACLLTTLGKLWLADMPIAWDGFYQHEQRRRVPLPTYPFERQRFWLEPHTGKEELETSHSVLVGKKPNIADWFYVPTWQPAPLLGSATKSSTWQQWMMFVDEFGFGAELVQYLELQGCTIIRVHAGPEFVQLDEQRFQIRPHVRDDYSTLFRLLSAYGPLPSFIAHLWNIDGDTSLSSGPEHFRTCQERGYYSLLALAQTLGEYNLDTTVQIAVFSDSVQPVAPSDNLSAEQATLLGLCKVVAQENLSVRCRSVDIVTPSSHSVKEELLDLLTSELTAQHEDLTVAYRGGQRLVQEFQAIQLEAVAGNSPSRLRPSGVYLLTGGLGGIGLTLAQYLARTVQAKLVLTGRTPLPERQAWDTWLASHGTNDSVSQKIRKVQTLEALGAEVLVLSADVADATQMRSVVAQTIECFGELHGVVHAAGNLDSSGFQTIPDLTPAHSEAHFQAKVHGLYVLEAVLGDLSLDFCVLCSSISSVLGGIGYAGYSAANGFIDAFTQRHNRTHPTQWTSVNWDTWQFKADQHEVIGATVAQFEMLPSEATEAFTRILSFAPAQLINSTGDLDARIRQWVQLESLRASIETPSMSLTGHARPALTTTYVAPMGEQEQRIAAVWQQVLGLAEVGIHDNFFDLGGNSLIGLQLIARLKQALHTQVPIVALFEAPTIHTLAAYLFPSPAPQADQAAQTIVARRQRVQQGRTTHDGIAIIGMVGRFPGAASVEQFWQNLQAGVEALTTFTDAELLAAGVAPELVHDPAYVKARPILDDVAHFDAAFFGYTPREAELMDPQQRLFHECAWEALELAGYDSLRYSGLIGIFGGANISSYLLQLLTDPQIRLLMNDATIADNDKDGLTTNVSYKLNLKGPSFAVQTFCSTSLVATHLACRSLRHGECDIALAGGVSVRVPVQAGYLYQEGDQVSPDGHIRTFDAQAGGAVWGDGVGVVVLKRLAEALADGDTIHAVIKGSAVNNDGGLKVGYTAPSVAGQTAAVVAALEDAGVPAESISYVEAHGTATPIGDPIEVASLTKAFRQTTDRTAFCYLGSVKPNVGHLDRAAGVTGLIKTVMALQHGLLPATLHFQQPNPEIDFAESPFVVTTALTPWPRNGSPRRAGVNSLGVGGTNAHVILEEAPLLPPSGPSRPVQLLLLSAKTATALETATSNLQHFLATHADVPLADVVYTLQVGRRRFAHRRMLVCRDLADALQHLAHRDGGPRVTREQADTTRPVAFLLGGVGEHYPGMAQALYQHEPTFHQAVDECCRLLQPLLNQDLRTRLWPSDSVPTAASSPHTLLSRNGHAPELGPLQQTALAQPAVFVVEYALAQLLASWGIRPSALLGYSLGEYVAACLAGVLSLPDALRLVATRAQLIQTLPPGAMLAVALDEAALMPYLSAEVALAAVNGPTTCVLAGTPTAIAAVAQQLTSKEIACRPVATTHAFHSPLLQPIADQLTAVARTLTFHPPQLPYLSNVTGTWITDQQATDPTYWAQHLCQTVRCEQGIAELLQRGEQVLVEVGVGQALGTFVKQHPACPRAQFGLVLPTLPSASDSQDALTFLLTTLGKLWLADIPIAWDGFAQHEQRRRVPLPTYPFERQRFWLEPRHPPQISIDPATLPRRTDVTEWFSVSSWKRASLATIDSPLQPGGSWLVLTDECGVGTALAAWLTEHHQHVVTVTPGLAFAKHGPTTYTVQPAVRADYEALLQALEMQQRMPHRVVHLWMVTASAAADDPTDEYLDRILDEGFYSLMALIQALGNQGVEACQINIISSAMQEVTGSEPLVPAKATLLGPCKIIPQEYPNLTSRSIDITMPTDRDSVGMSLVPQLVHELIAGTEDDIVALRGAHRWLPLYEPLPLAAPARLARLRHQGVYLITGGLGGIGLALADYLFSTVQAKLVLLNRTPLPPRATWPVVLAAPETPDVLRQRITQVQALEARGAALLLLQADVADAPQVHAAVHQATTHFGTLNGVFHTAGVPGVGLLQLKTPEAASAVLAPKVQGTLALAAAVRDLPLDCLVLFSSVTSATGGGPGQVDYCAANAFLDAYARQHCAEHGLTVAISWGEWQWDAWQAGLQGFPEDVRQRLIANRLEYGIGFPEGMDALQRILSHALPHIFVTTQELNAMVAGSKHSSAADAFELLQAERQTRPLYPRPMLSTSYAAPSNDLEEQIAVVWRAVLGIAEVGMDDNFCDLGGNSLLGIALLAQTRKALKLDRLPAYVLYEAPSIRSLAAHIGQSQDQTIDDADMEDRGDKRKAQLEYLQRRAHTGAV